MNNYCTNCGEKFNKKDLICPKCNTPIIDDSVKTSKTNIALIIVFALIIIGFVGTYFFNIIKENYMENKILNDYVNPYLKNNNIIDANVKYSETGKCITSGNCKFDYAMGCDGGSCDEFTYLSEDECTAYYYQVKTHNEIFDLTVFNKNSKYSIIRGYNVLNEDFSGIYYAYAFPYESNYLKYVEIPNGNRLYLDSNDYYMLFYPSINEENVNIHGYQYLKNYNDSVRYDISVIYYDINYNMIGNYNNIINIDHYNYEFNLTVDKDALSEGKTIEDVKYYKLIINSYDLY